MIFVSLNVRGVTGVEKAIWVREVKSSSKALFLGLQETHQFSIDKGFWGKFWGNSVFDAVHVDSTGRSGGLVSIWDPGWFKVDGVIKDGNFIITSGVASGFSERLNVINIYAPNLPVRRKVLWDKIAEVMGRLEGCWILLGDFNEVRRRAERLNSEFDASAANIFNSFIREVGLFEYRMYGGKFTCISDHTDVKFSKLDRFLVCSKVMNAWQMRWLK